VQHAARRAGPHRHTYTQSYLTQTLSYHRINVYILAIYHGRLHGVN
jgi:hypothetical protein